MEIEQLKHVGTKQERSCEFKVVPIYKFGDNLKESDSLERQHYI